jgi:hypothetical protein
MNRLKLRRPFAVVLTLTLFVGWLALGVAHHHADRPGCELCKAMQYSTADLARPAGPPTPALTAEPIALVAVDAHAEQDLPLHRGRAPPLA